MGPNAKEMLKWILLCFVRSGNSHDSKKKEQRQFYFFPSDKNNNNRFDLKKPFFDGYHRCEPLHFWV